jgi:hypothetical protein
MAERAAFGLGRGFQAGAVDIEQPAMKRAPQAAVFQPPEREIGAAMRTSAREQSVAALIVAEDDEIFAQQPHRLDRPVAGELVDQRSGLPIAAHQLAGTPCRDRSG